MTASDESVAHDPGGRVRLAVDSAVASSALFSSCGRYRSLLTRTWDSKLSPIMFVGMNPSVADLEVDDPTVRKECNLARRWGYGSLIKCNVMDYRATNPKQLLSQSCVSSEQNLPTISQQLQLVDTVVAAWGRLPPVLQPHADAAFALLKSSGVKIMCLGRNQDLSPRHPLYLSYSTPLEPYQGKTL